MNTGMNCEFITGERFQEIADITITNLNKSKSHNNPHFTSKINFCVFQQNPNGSVSVGRGDFDKIGRSSIIFVYSDLLELFFISVLPAINHPFVLISHNSDAEIDHRYRSYLDNRYLKRWYAQNLMPGFKHDKLVSIPIGLGNAQWDHGNLAEFSQIGGEKSERDILLYANFNTATNRIHREGIRRVLAEKDFSVMESGASTSHYWKTLKRSRFVASPRGNGVDCHRTWEALYLGAVPILDREDQVACLDGLPVLGIQNWRELNKEDLDHAWQKMMETSYDYERLRFSYWQHRIEADAAQAKGH